MMGMKARLFTPISALSLDELVPADHFYRHLDRALDLSFVRDLVQDRYVADKGRPSVDPVVFFRLQLVMFFEGIRSERQLLRLAADRLSVRWFLGYNLGEPLPDHSSLTRIRTRYGLAVFRRFFETIVEQCQQAGLVWGKELYFDATQVFADAARDSLTPRFAVDARQRREAAQAANAVEAHLATIFADSSASDSDAGGPPFSPSPPADALLAPAAPQVPPEPVPLPVSLTPEQRDELLVANAARHDWIAAAGQQQREVAHGTYARMANFWVSTTDPDATLMPVKGGGKHLGYHVHYAVDGGRARIITQVLTTPSEVMENQPMLDLLWRVQFRHHLWPHQITGDTTYGTLEIIKAVEDAGIRAYVPLADFDHRTPTSALTSSTMTPSMIAISVPQARSCGSRRIATPCATSATVLRPPPATPVRSKRTARAVLMAGSSRAPSTSSIWTACVLTIRRRPTGRRCASARSGSNRSSPRPRTGTAYDGFACAACGA